MKIEQSQSCEGTIRELSLLEAEYCELVSECTYVIARCPEANPEVQHIAAGLIELAASLIETGMTQVCVTHSLQDVSQTVQNCGPDTTARDLDACVQRLDDLTSQWNDTAWGFIGLVRDLIESP